VLTFSDVITPFVVAVNVRYRDALVVVSVLIVKPEPAVDHDVFVPSVVKNLPELPVCEGSRLLRAPLAVVEPVPPLATFKVPAMVIVPLETIGPPLVVSPVVPPETLTLETPPPVPVKGVPAGPINVIKAKVVGSYKA
jgi:hypothetical protein